MHLKHYRESQTSLKALRTGVQQIRMRLQHVLECSKSMQTSCRPGMKLERYTLRELVAP